MAGAIPITTDELADRRRRLADAVSAHKPSGYVIFDSSYAQYLARFSFLATERSPGGFLNMCCARRYSAPSSILACIAFVLSFFGTSARAFSVFTAPERQVWSLQQWNEV